MDDLYYTLNLPSTYSSVYTLTKATAGIKSRKNVQNWLAGQDAYTLHKPVRRKFLRRQTFAPGINHLFQADLMDMSQHQRNNDGFRFVLVIIDVFSKVAWVRAIKNKSALVVTNAF